jgi:hypothetical protein
VGPTDSFFTVISRAVADLVEHGYDSEDRLAYWVRSIREAALRSLTPPAIMERALNDTLRALYRAQVERGAILRRHPGIARFTIEQVKPKLRTELDRRILASASLIRLNREQEIARTLQRFSGWATSIPPGGTEAAKRREVKEQIRKPLASLSFRERRVLTDQGHKFVANLSEILATDGGAIAGIWHSHWREAGYQFRPEHKARDLQVYLLRDSWAHKAGLVKPGEAGYLDQITQAGEEISCRCWVQYLYALRSLPAEMLTEKGRAELARVRMAA